jgi:hypothetical protein
MARCTEEPRDGFPLRLVVFDDVNEGRGMIDAA